MKSHSLRQLRSSGLDSIFQITFIEGSADLRQGDAEWKCILLRLGKLYFERDLLFGWNISVLNTILGGWYGNSSGKRKVASKRPPSNGVPSGPWKHTLHLNRSSSSKPTEIDKSDSHFCVTEFLGMVRSNCFFMWSMATL